MKRTLILLRTLGMIVLMTQLTACKKILDVIFGGHHHNADCYIHSITQEVTDGAFRTAIFYNNDHGDPDSVIFDTPAGSAGAQFFYYYYDQHNRLIGFDAYYDRDPGNYFFKHTYTYENGRIVRDTVKISQAGRWTTVLELEYDNQNRVIAEVGRVIETEGEPVPEPEPFTLLYQLDTRGNLELVNHTYDDKINFLRTSRTLMFTERNYSMNNPTGASGYNEEDLPLGFPGFGANLFPTSHWAVIQRNAPSEITYDCH